MCCCQICLLCEIFVLLFCLKDLIYSLAFIGLGKGYYWYLLFQGSSWRSAQWGYHLCRIIRGIWWWSRWPSQCVPRRLVNFLIQPIKKLLIFANFICNYQLLHCARGLFSWRRCFFLFNVAGFRNSHINDRPEVRSKFGWDVTWMQKYIPAKALWILWPQTADFLSVY